MWKAITNTLRNPWVLIALCLAAMAGVLLWLYKRTGTVNAILNSVGIATRYLWPVLGHTRISSPFGPRVAPRPGASSDHKGIDIPAPVGTMIVSPARGVVKSATTGGTGGKQLSIEHDDGYISGYAHLQERLVDVGERVERGEPIALVGATGNVTGPHLHLSMRDPRGVYVDPQELLAA